jgi:hypothetical protein
MALHINADGRSAGFFVKELATLPDQGEVVIAVSDQRYVPLVRALNFVSTRAELIDKGTEWHPVEAVTLQDYAKQQSDNGQLGTPYMAADPALVAHYLQQLEEWTADQDGVLRVPVTVNFAKANTDGNATQTAAEKIEYAKTVQSVDYNLLTGAFRESQDKLAKAGTKVQYVPVAMQHSFGGINPEAQYDAAALAYPDVDPVSYFTNPDGNRLDLNQDFIGMVAAYEAIEQFSAKGNLAYSAGVASTNQHQQMSVQDSKCHTVVPIIALVPRSDNPTEGGELWVEESNRNYDQVHVLQSRAEGDWTGTQQELAG